MVVKRIVANVAASRVDAARGFYGAVLGLEVVMDLGWILTFAARGVETAPQISIASEGGSGAPVPDISVEVDDLALRGQFRISRRSEPVPAVRASDRRDEMRE